MPDFSVESVVELLGVAVEVVAMVILSGIGVLAERAGFASLSAGPDPAAIWLLAVGAVALYAGVYMIGYRRLLVRAGVATA